MKDLKVYDGAGWQSLKGPPGPSKVSTDAGNAAFIGSDGLIVCPQEVSFMANAPPLPEGADAVKILPLLWVEPYSGRVFVASPEQDIFNEYGEFLGKAPAQWLPACRPSADAGNHISVGSDGLPFVPAPLPYGEWDATIVSGGGGFAIQKRGFWRVVQRLDDDAVRVECTVFFEHADGVQYKPYIRDFPFPVITDFTGAPANAVAIGSFALDAIVAAPNLPRAPQIVPIYEYATSSVAVFMVRNFGSKRDMIPFDYGDGLGGSDEIELASQVSISFTYTAYLPT